MSTKERPILFSGPMVRALLDGSKTQTRRVMKRQPPAVIQDGYLPKVYWPARDKHMSSRGDRAYLQFEQPGEYDGRHIMKDGYGFECPHGQPGDRLWVRETWAIECLGRVGTPEGYDCSYELEYRADGATREFDCPPGTDDSAYLRAYDRMRGDWWPSIHMPRWASRITLEVTGVRVERLQDISRGDAMDEGCPFPNMAAGDDPRQWFSGLWSQINGAESWDANPWVWVVEFKRVT